jgi:NAD(P)-dependent dehydrogenase (short-subunit alcohol dehydrogenase family)
MSDQRTRENIVAVLNFKKAFDLSGKVVLITGAAGGIGKNLTELFADRGARLALVDRNAGVTTIAKTLGEEHLGLVLDVTDEQAVVRGVRKAAEVFGGIDVLINNAGIGGIAPALTTSTELWDMTQAVNLRAPFLFCREVAPYMLRRGAGRIISIASQAAVIGIEEHAAYSASKAGLLGMTNVMAVEWGPGGITVNCISPTVVETDMAKTWEGEKGERARAEIPTRRFAQPMEIAMAALYLASDAAGMVNGANLMVDGGYTIR